MHEMGLTRRVLEQVREVLAAHGGGSVREIRVQVGPLSGVEPDLMLSAFELLREEASLTEARLTIEQIPLEARCHGCARLFQPVQFRFRCPRCGATDVEVVRGDGVILESIALDQSAMGAPT